MEWGRGYRVLIVDDESIIRERLKLHVMNAGFEIAGLAENGVHALDIYKKTKPHIILSDIEMPLMNGTTLLQTIRKKDSQVKFVFLTGYSEFNYAMSAIKHNASEYLLKPLDSKKIYALLERIVEEIYDEIKLETLVKENDFLKENEYISKFFSDGLLNRNISEEIQKFLEDPKGIRLFLIHGKIDTIESEEPIHPINNNYLILLPKDKGIDDISFSPCYAAIGQNCYTRGDLTTSYQMLRRTLLNRFFTPEKYLYNGIDSMNVEKEKVQEMNQQNKLLIRSNNINELIKLIDTELNELKTPGNLEYFVFLLKGLLLKESERIPGTKLNNHSPLWILEQFRDFDLFRNWLQTLLQKIFSEERGRNDLELYIRVKQYLHENYSSSINLETIAMNVFAHPNYISFKFKEETGITVTEYLSSLRLERAKELLSSTELSCKRISQIVGFHDQFYFGKCFKKKFGMTPTSIQKKNSIHPILK